MDTRKSSEPAAGFTPATSAGRAAANDGGAFRIRYGRTAIALAGLLSFHHCGGHRRPADLRDRQSLASARSRIPDRRRRRRASAPARRPGPPEEMNAAFSAAMDSRTDGSPRTERTPGPESSGETAVQRESAPFRRRSRRPPAQAPDRGGTPRGRLGGGPCSGRQQRQAASGAATASPATAGNTGWEPVEVPKPTYVEAAKADRPAPEPLDLPESPEGRRQAVAQAGPCRRARRRVAECRPCTAPHQGPERAQQPGRRLAAPPRLGPRPGIAARHSKAGWKCGRKICSLRKPALRLLLAVAPRGYSSVGRALRSHRRGQGFESP